MWLQTWRANLTTHIRCSSYTVFKHDHVIESYLYKLSNSLRINLTKFRCRCNKLPISHKFNEQQIYDVNCKICESNEIGDEFHYIFICHYFKEERTKFLQPYYRHYPSMYKFEQLFSSNNSRIVSDLAKFVTVIMNKFR